jgi:ATP-dependent Clp protease ATP-binding subunit ClpB
VLGAGKAEGAMDAANLLKPMLARGELRTIGATTLAEYRQHIEKDAAFERRFQQVVVGEPSVPDTISILRGLKEKYEVRGAWGQVLLRKNQLACFAQLSVVPVLRQLSAALAWLFNAQALLSTAMIEHDSAAAL